MDTVEQLLKRTVEELDRLLNAKNVLGDPIEKNGATIIPIVSYGFAFGAGGGTDAKTNSGGGSGAGGGIKPLGAIIVDKDGARVEGIQRATPEIVRVAGAAATRAIDRLTEPKPGKKDT